MSTLYQWECPDCEAITNGSEPERTCNLCGQGNIVRNLTAEETPTDYDAQLEASINPCAAIARAEHSEGAQ